MALGLIQFRCSSVQPPGGAGTVTLQEIDGGPTYYADHGFTNAVNAGYDSKSFVEFGTWPTYLGTQVDADNYKDLGIKSAFVVNSGDASLCGATNDIWWWAWLRDNNATLMSQMATNPSYLVGINIADEPGNWITDVTDLLVGNLVGYPMNVVSNKATVCVGKPLYVDFFNNLLGGGLTNTPIPGQASSYFTTDIFDPGGHARRLNLSSFDCYWFSGSSDQARIISPTAFGTFSAIRALTGDSTHGGYPLTIAGGTVNIPTSFPTNVTFTTRAGLPVAIGAACLVEASGGASYQAMIGAVTAYDSTSGVTTIQIVDGHTYTAIAASGFAGSSYGLVQFQVAATDLFAWTGSGANPLITDVTTPGNIPAGTHFGGSDSVSGLSLGSNGTAWNFFTDVNASVAVNDVVKIATTITLGGTSGPQGNFKAKFGMTVDLARRACHYGDMIDAQRGFQYSTPGFSPSRDPAPIGQFLDNAGAFQNCGADLGSTFAQYPTPVEINAAAWSVIMHGGLRVFWFDSCYGGTQQSQSGASNVSRATYFRTIQGANNYFGVPNTISIYDQMKLTHRFVQKLAPVINSKFAFNYVSVSPRGQVAPFPASYVQNDGIAYAYGWDNLSPSTGVFNNDLGLVNGANSPTFEVMAKYYNDPSSGIFVQGHYWIFAAYRASPKDTNQTATFTIAAAAATVTRFCMDAVISAAASGNSPGDKTRITCSDTSQMVVGDPATFQATAGFTIAGSSPNGVTFNISAIPDGTHFEVPGVFGGSAPGGSSPGVLLGQVLVSHDINTTGGGLTFTDVFARGTDIRIYRVN